MCKMGVEQMQVYSSVKNYVKGQELVASSSHFAVTIC